MLPLQSSVVQSFASPEAIKYKSLPEGAFLGGVATRPYGQIEDLIGYATKICKEICKPIKSSYKAKLCKPLKAPIKSKILEAYVANKIFDFKGDAKLCMKILLALLKAIKDKYLPFKSDGDKI